MKAKRTVTLLTAIVAWAIVSMSSSPPCRADDASASDPAKDENPAETFFDTTTVTALGREARTFEVATPVTVLPKLELERRFMNQPADALRDQPGVDVNGIGLNQARPVIRGQRGLRILFLADGLRMNNARRQSDFGEVTSLIDVDDIQAMEVVRGPASVLYGSDAIGGVLNLITKDAGATEGLAGTFNARYGSAGDLARGSVSLEGRRNRLGWRLGGSYRDASDYEAPSGRFGLVRLANDTTVVDTALTDRSIDGALDYRLSDGQTLRFKANDYHAGSTGFGLIEPGLLEANPVARTRIYYPFQDFQRYALSWNGIFVGGPADTADLRLFSQNNERALTNDIFVNIGPIFPGAPNSSVVALSNNYTDLETLGVRGELIKDFGGKNLLTYGFECSQDDSFNTDRSLSTTTIRFPFPPFQSVSRTQRTRANTPNAQNTACGAFAQNEFALGARLKFNAGLRYQEVTTKAKPTPDWAVRTLDYSDRSSVGALTATWAVRDYLNAFVSYGTAFRAPNIIERLFTGPIAEASSYQILNPDLAAEESDNWDVGIKYHRSHSFLEVVAFRTDLDKGIIRYFLTASDQAALPADLRAEIARFRPSTVVQQRNIDRLRYEGVEMALGYRWERGLTLGANYTHLSGKRFDTIAPPTGDTYSDKYSAFARWEGASKPYWLEYRVRRNAEDKVNLQPGDLPPVVGRILPGFTIHNLAGGVTFGPWAGLEHTLMLEVANATDELYAEFSNASFFRPEPGRRVNAIYRLKF